MTSVGLSYHKYSRHADSVRTLVPHKSRIGHRTLAQVTGMWAKQNHQIEAQWRESNKEMEIAVTERRDASAEDVDSLDFDDLISFE